MSGLEDPGDPTSYVTLSPGTPVYSADGVRFATVSQVLAAEREDIFDGIIVSDLDHKVVGGGSRHRFVDASEVDRLYERAVMLTLDAADCRSLPAPSDNPVQPTDGPGNEQPSALGGKLRRAWDALSGNR